MRWLQNATKHTRKRFGFIAIFRDTFNQKFSKLCWRVFPLTFGEIMMMSVQLGDTIESQYKNAAVFQRYVEYSNN